MEKGFSEFWETSGLDRIGRFLEQQKSGSVAQLVELRTFNPTVAGSTPAEAQHIKEL